MNKPLPHPIYAKQHTHTITARKPFPDPNISRKLSDNLAKLDILIKAIGQDLDSKYARQAKTDMIYRTIELSNEEYTNLI